MTGLTITEQEFKDTVVSRLAITDETEFNKLRRARCCLHL
jgi:hypothetical protein